MHRFGVTHRRPAALVPPTHALPAAPPHGLPAAERYAHLTASMLLLHADFLDGPLDTNIERLRYAGQFTGWLAGWLAGICRLAG